MKEIFEKMPREEVVKLAETDTVLGKAARKHIVEEVSKSLIGELLLGTLFESALEDLSDVIKEFESKKEEEKSNNDKLKLEVGKLYYIFWDGDFLEDQLFMCVKTDTKDVALIDIYSGNRFVEPTTKDELEDYIYNHDAAVFVKATDIELEIKKVK